MLGRNLGRPCGGTRTPSPRHPRIGLNRSTTVRVAAFKGSDAGRPAAAAVQCIAPSNDLHITEQAIITFGQAFMTHELHRKLNSKLGREQELFAGISRLMLDSFPDEPVLFVSQQGPAHAAAVLLSSSQEAQLVALQQQVDFEVIPGTLQMLQAIPQSSMPIMMAAFRSLHEAGAAAMHSAGHSQYLKLMLLAARPEAQRSGLGSAVLDAAVAAADAQRLPLYLEAANEGLVPMYERYGFKAVGRLDLMMLMVRERL